MLEMLLWQMADGWFLMTTEHPPSALSFYDTRLSDFASPRLNNARLSPGLSPFGFMTRGQGYFSPKRPASQKPYLTPGMYGFVIKQRP